MRLFIDVLEGDQRDGQAWTRSLNVGTLMGHYSLQILCRQYLRATHLHLEDPEASESEGNISNSSESADSHSLDDSQSNGQSSRRASVVVKQACIKVDTIGAIRCRRKVQLFESRLGRGKFPVPITCELLAAKSSEGTTKCFGVRISAYDINSSSNHAILFIIDDLERPHWKREEGPPLETLMVEVGFNYLLSNCVEFVCEIEAVEGPPQVQTNSTVARDYLGAGLDPEAVQYDRVTVRLKDDKLALPSTDHGQHYAQPMFDTSPNESRSQETSNQMNARNM